MKWMMPLVLSAMMCCTACAALQRGRVLVTQAKNCTEAVTAAQQFFQPKDEKTNTAPTEEKTQAEIQRFTKGLNDCLTLVAELRKEFDAPNPTLPPADPPRSLASATTPSAAPAAPSPAPTAPLPAPTASTPSPASPTPTVSSPSSRMPSKNLGAPSTNPTAPATNRTASSQNPIVPSPSSRPPPSHPTAPAAPATSPAASAGAHATNPTVPSTNSKGRRGDHIPI